MANMTGRVNYFSGTYFVIFGTHSYLLLMRLIIFPKMILKYNQKEKKFRQTFEKMEGFSFVTPVTGLNRPNNGKEDDDDDDETTGRT
jgi:hypothetical protein